jgi:hypothetical protein
MNPNMKKKAESERRAPDDVPQLVNMIEAEGAGRLPDADRREYTDDEALEAESHHTTPEGEEWEPSGIPCAEMGAVGDLGEIGELGSNDAAYPDNIDKGK